MSTTSPYAVSFWWVVGLALVLLVPLRSATARKWVLAGLNLSVFLRAMKSGGRGAVVEVLGVLALAVLASIFLWSCASRFGAVGVWLAW